MIDLTEPLNKAYLRHHTNGCLRRLFLLFGVLLAAMSPAHASPPPPDWYQVNQDGFVAGSGASSNGTSLLTFDDTLYALNSTGLFRMDSDVAKAWTKLTPPAPPTGPGQAPIGLRVLGGFLYSWNQGGLWYVPPGKDPGGANWIKVNWIGPSGGVSPTPLCLFANKIYGVLYPTQGGFEIWRSGSAGSASIVWERVVENAFGDPGNNKSVDAMAVFNGHVYVMTGTLKYVFGAPQGKDTGGVEVWESGSGDLGAWTQVNVDGFGSSIPFPGDPSKKLYTNHVVGTAAVHQGYLYVGTKSHWGAEIWRYDGTGKAGWVNLTPSWAGPGPFFPSDTLRFEALISFGSDLYAAEGYPSGNLARFDGKSWKIVVQGPDPFDPNNQRLSSIASLKNRLYVGAGWPAGSKGDQVWGFPVKTPKADVKANGSDGPISVLPTAPVIITVTLDAGEIVGQMADWYLVALAPWGIYSVVWGKGWVPGIVPFLAYPLFDLPSPLPIFNAPLPAGTYLAVFGVDDRPDGQLNGTIWWDYIAINSKP